MFAPASYPRVSAKRPTPGLAFAPPAIAAGAYALTAILCVGLRRSAARPAPTIPAAAGAPFRADLAEGLRFWRSSTVLARLLAVTTVVVGAVAFAQAALILYIIDVLGVPEALFGVFSVALALGGLAGMAAAAPVARRLGRVRSLSWVIVVLAAGLALMGAASEPVLGAAALFGISLAAAVWNVLAVSARQALTPDHLMGRVQGYARTVLVVAVLAAGPAGGLLARINLRAPVWVAAVVILATAIATARLLPRLDDPRSFSARDHHADDGPHTGRTPID